MSKGGTGGRNRCAIISFRTRCTRVCARLNIPSRICVRPPSTADTAQLVIDREIVEAKLVLQLVRHCNAGGTGTNDDGIERSREFRHFGAGAGWSLLGLLENR